MFEHIVYVCSVLVFLTFYGVPTPNELAQLYMLSMQLWYFDVLVLMPIMYYIIDMYDLHYIPGHIV
uniref:Uncharacterized protein n=1 Tax=Bird deltacoronavirus ArenariaCN24 TaxID=3237948 RepID=A0AB39AFQ2_9NIDO